MKLAVKKVWKFAHRGVVERRHEIWFWKNVYSSRLNSFYGKLILNLRWCILFLSIFNILENLDTLITLYYFIFFCLQMELEENENNLWISKKKCPNKSSHGISHSLDERFNQQWWSIYISIQVVVFSKIVVSENHTFCLM